jgi:uncharacterized membrane protein YhaH (DUF805 family)
MINLKLFCRHLSDSITVGFIILYFYSISAWNPDPHHDGIQFTSGTAAANGKIAHLDFFEQYGPLNAYFHGAALYIFGDYLLVLRFLTVGILAFISILMLHVMRVHDLGATSRSLLVILWALSCPVTSLTDNMYGLYPWPSLTTQLFSLACIVILIKIGSSKPTPISKLDLLFLSLLSVGIFFTRIQVGFLTIVVILFVLGNLEVDTKNRYQIRKAYLKYLVSLFIPILFFGLASRSFLPFMDQIIIGPFDVYSNPMNWDLLEGYLKVGIPLAVLLALTSIVFFFCTSRRKSFLIYIGLVLTYLGIQMNPDQNQFTTQVLLRELGVGPNSNYQANFMALSYLSASLILAILVLEKMGFSKRQVFFPKIRAVSKKLLKRSKASTSMELRMPTMSNFGMISLMSIPSLVLLYPLPSSYHVWWSSPVVVIMFAIGLRVIAPKNRFREIVFLPLFLPTLVVLLLSWNSAMQRNWITLENGAMKNMKVESEYSQSYYRMDEFLNIEKTESISAICFDGMFVSWDGDFNSNGPKVVSWGFGLRNSAEPKAAERMFLCSDDEFARNFASTNKVIITRELEYNLSWWSKGKIFEYEPIP